MSFPMLFAFAGLFMRAGAAFSAFILAFFLSITRAATIFLRQALLDLLYGFLGEVGNIYDSAVFLK